MHPFPSGQNPVVPSRDPNHLRVALDATPLLGKRTGVGAFVASALDALTTDGTLELRAYALSWLGFRSLAATLPDGVGAVAVPMPPQPLRAAWARGNHPAIEWWVRGCDVVHGTNFVAPPTRRAAAVVSIYDMTPFRHRELTAGDPLLYPALVRRAIGRGAWVHTMSEFVAAEVVEELGADPGRVQVVAGGVPPVAPADPRRGHGLAGGDRYVLSLSTIEPRKDHPGLVRAFDRLADSDARVRLVIAGMEAWGSTGLDAALTQARHRDRIERLGYVDADDRAALLRGASVLAFPSRYEGFGLPPLEAMSVGVPVVATRAGSLPEVLAGAALLVDVGDDEALAGELARALDDEPTRQRLREAGLLRAAHYSWARCGQELAALYRRAAGR